MIDLEDLPVTTAEGRRPSSTGGDRLMIGLAALALIGGGLIAISRLLPSSDSAPVAETTATAEPSASPVSSATPRPTPSPPPLDSFQLQSDVPPEPAPPEQPLFSGWARAKERILIRGSQFDGAFVLRTLQPGQAAYLWEQEGSVTGSWYNVNDPVYGWVRKEGDGAGQFQFFTYHAISSGSISELQAGPDGFAALGTSAYVDNHADFLLASSSDGAVWRADESPPFRDWSGGHLVHGPAGWLLLAERYTDQSVENWVWRSSDLGSWDALGSMATFGRGGDRPAQVVGNDAGYVMLGEGWTSGAPSVWYSTDGILWSERRPVAALSSGTAPVLVATPLGFYIQDITAVRGERIASFSIDGWDWSEVDVTTFGDHSDRFVGAAAAGDQLLAIVQPSRGDPGAWVGSIVGDRLTWQPDLQASPAFSNSVVTAIVSDGIQPIAFGWARDTYTPLWWVHGEAGWEGLQLPVGYQGLPRIAAAGPQGYVLVGERRNTRGENPVLWHYRDGLWEPEAEPFVELAPDPHAAQCAEIGSDLLDVMSVSGSIMAHCFGHSPITVRAWGSACGFCFGRGSGRWETRWLAEPDGDRLLSLSPGNGYENSLQAVLPPSLARGDWYDNWLDVTGHFDDPAAGSCRWLPPPEEEFWYGGQEETVTMCRGRFVVDRVQITQDQE